MSMERRRFLGWLSFAAGVHTVPGCGGGADAAAQDAVTGAPPLAESTPPANPPQPAPSPPPPQGSTSTSSRQFTLLAPRTGTHPFCVGYAFREGEVPAGWLPRCEVLQSQVTPKSTWPDGSLRHAVVAGMAELTAGNPQRVGFSLQPEVALDPPLATAQLRATGARAVVGCGGFGSVQWTGADWDSPFITWVAGPAMSSWIYRRAVGSDPHLVAWLEVRLWAGGAVEVLPWVENGYLKVGSPTNKAATYHFSLGGVELFRAAIDLPNHCRTPLVSGAALAHWLGSDPELIVQHDAAYLQSTRLVPTYMAETPPSAPVVAVLPAAYTPLQLGNYPVGMGTAGYHGSIGLLPEWDVLYLTSGARNTWAALQRNAYSAGRFGIHFRDETTQRPLQMSRHPTLVLGAGSGVSGSGTSAAGSYTANATGTVPAGYASSHAPALGYMAYLVTGRFYHLETLQFQATLHYLKNGDQVRGGAAGIFKSNAGANTTRGAAWALRTLAQAAVATPDDDVLAPDFHASLRANIDYLHARYIAKPNNPLGFVTPYSDYTPPVVATTVAGSNSTQIVLPGGYVHVTDGYYVGWQLAIGGEVRTVTAYAGATRTATVSEAYTVATSAARFELRSDAVYYEASWMQDFFTAAIGLMKAMKPTLGAETQTKLDTFFAWKARSVVGRLGSAVGTDYLYRDAAPYTIAVAPTNFPDYEGGTGPWFTHWGQCYDATFAAGSAGPKVDGPLRGGNMPEASSYWGNMQPAIAYAVEHGVPGAAAAYARMRAADNWAALRANFNATPVWSVRPRE